MDTHTTPSHYTSTTPPNNEVIFADDDIIVANKRPSLLSVPGKTVKESLYSVMQIQFDEVHVAHRLDCETSGIMVFARNKASERELHRQFREGLIEKAYEALGYGSCEESHGEINLPLIADWPNRPKQKVDFENGKPSKTLWSLLERNATYSRFDLTPITGRSHQLRVHLQSLGHPILGDKLYAHTIEPINDVLYPNMCLHAKRLTLTHPTRGTPFTFESSVPF